MVAADGGIDGRNNRVGGFAENDLHANRQRSEDMLLRKTEGRKVAL
jgi:hypothetical protein